MKMRNLVESDEFDPKKVYDDLMKGCLNARLWEIKCYVDESFVFIGKLPFDLMIKDGTYVCKVVSTSKKEAMKLVSDFIPVIKFIEEDEK